MTVKMTDILRAISSHKVSSDDLQNMITDYEAEQPQEVVAPPVDAAPLEAPAAPVDAPAS